MKKAAENLDLGNTCHYLIPPIVVHATRPPHMYAFAQTLMHAHTNAHAHKHRHTHARTHGHTQTAVGGRAATVVIVQ